MTAAMKRTFVVLRACHLSKIGGLWPLVGDFKSLTRCDRHSLEWLGSTVSTESVLDYR